MISRIAMARHAMKMIWLSIAVACACVYAEACQPSQERFAGSCYQQLTEEMAWIEDEPAVPDSVDVLFISETLGDFWNGCRDEEEQGKWIYPREAGRRCGCFYWTPDKQYDNNGNTDCLAMFGHWFGFYDDDSCSEMKFVICEGSDVLLALPGRNCMEAGAKGRFVPSPCLTDSHVIKEFPAEGVVACGAACRDEPGCCSFNLRAGESREGSICQLNNITNSQEEKKLMMMDGKCYYLEP